MGSTKTVRILADIVAAILVVVPTIVLYVGYVTPTQRGFFCDDESIRYPYKESDTVSISLVAAVSITSTLLLLFTTELLLYKSAVKDGVTVKPKAICCCSHFNPWFYTVCGYFWVLQFGAMVTQALTDVGKYSVGRLRPNFIAGCEPDIDFTRCTVGEYITNFNCTQTDSDIVHFVRTSFPSGHASQSAYVSIFLSYYIQMRIPRCAISYLYMHLLQFALIIAAWFCGLSRVVDNKHHPTDVLAGFIVGALVALLTARYLAKSFRDLYGNTEYSSSAIV